MRKIWEKHDNISCDLLCKISHCIVHAVFSEEAETFYIPYISPTKGSETTHHLFVFHLLWRLSSPASAVPVVSPFLLTQPTCVWPACALRSTSQRESPSKSQCISASSVNGAFHAFNNKHITVVFVLYTAMHPLYHCFSLEGIYR